jgi:hypothetical protein
MLETSNEPILDDADNIDLGRGEEFAQHNHGAEGSHSQQRVLNGVPDGWVPPGPPPNWAGYKPKGNAPQSAEDIENPGSWSLYSFAAKYKKRSDYSGHFTPTRAMIIPADADG